MNQEIGEKQQHSKFQRSVAWGLTWMYLSSVIQAVLKLGVLAALARLLEPSDFGLLGIALIFTSCAERIGQVGVGPALVQRAELNDSDINAGTALSLISGVVIALTLVIASPFVADFFSAAEVRAVLVVLATGFVIDGFAVVSDCLMQRKLRFREIMVAENTSYFIGNGCVAIALAWYGFGVWALVAGSIAMKLVRAVMIYKIEPVPLFRRFDGTTAKHLLTRGMGFSLTRVLSFFSLQGDNLMVGRLLGVDALGMYTRAYQLMTLPATYLGQVLERVLFPAMSQKQNDPERLKLLFFSSLEVVTLVALPTSVGMFLVAPEIISVLFGSKWSTLVPVLEILSLGVFFRTAYKCSDTLARSLGALYDYAVRQTVYTLLVVGGSALGAYLYGLQGVAVAVVIAVAVNYVLMTRLSARSLGIAARHIVAPHLPGVWVGFWVALSLLLTLPSIRAAFGAPLLTLTLAVAVSTLGALLSLVIAPGFRPTLLTTLLRKFSERRDKVKLRREVAA